MKKLKMPLIGLGTWKINKQETINKVIFQGIKNGKYRLIDTAQCYNNEYQIGQALKKYKIDSNKIFITSKVWILNFKYYTYRSIQNSIKRLNVKKINLMLLHASVNNKINLIAYKELIRAKKDNLVDYIGVSNWTLKDIKYVYAKTKIYPEYCQFILSPIHRIKSIENFCKKNKIKITGYSIMRPYYNPHPVYKKSNSLSLKQKKIIDKIATKHNVSPGVILLSWAIQLGYYVIPKSTNPVRIKENFNCKKVKLNNFEIKKINLMNHFNNKKKLLIFKKSLKIKEITDSIFKKGFLFEKNYKKGEFFGR